jgi:hypothetical protein
MLSAGYRGSIYTCRLADLYEDRFLAFAFYAIAFQDLGTPLPNTFDEILAWVRILFYQSPTRRQESTDISLQCAPSLSKSLDASSLATGDSLGLQMQGKQ